MYRDKSNYILRMLELDNGKELILRKPNVDDANEMVSYLNTVGGESNNLLFGKNEFRLTIEEERVYLENLNINPNTLMVLALIENQIVGVAQISSSNRKRIAHNSEISISVKKDHWSCGIGSALMEELIKYAQEHIAIRNISLGVKASNTHAMKMYEKFGFKKVGIHANYFNINGEYDDEILMDLAI